MKVPSYRKLLKKAISQAKKEASTEASKSKKKKTLQENAKKMANKMTKPEIIFANMMDELGIKYENQKIVGNKIFDFYIPSKNMIIEVDGDYFHANPLIYSSDSLNNMQKKNKNNDIYKDLLAKGNGYEIQRIWEYDLNNNYNIQKKRFKKLLTDG